MELFSGLIEFVRIVELRSFKKAAESLNLSKSAVSKSILRLETRIGVRLLNRTTRSVSPTYEGELFYWDCKKIIEAMSDSIDNVVSYRNVPKGKIRVESVVSFGNRILVPALPEFFRLYPEISLDLRLNDHLVDMNEDNIDVVIRIGTPRDPNLIAREILSSRMVLAAAPDYLKSRGMPVNPLQLNEYKCLKYSLPDGRTYNWKFMMDGLASVIQTPDKIEINNTKALIDLAVSGQGVIQLMDFIIEPELSSGALIEILPDFSTPSVPVYIGYRHNRYMSSKVRAFIDFISSLAADQSCKSSDTNRP
ncbi:LysR family transcriptional regulator [Enterobacter asburiae]|uniref:LysR family transcriptional regulator n=1 Tax=Enterobacter asburiae TaxID=61645 RepID=UPI0034E86791|nr:LysR family transcriptional regulator [Enterobacter asburiae]